MVIISNKSSYNQERYLNFFKFLKEKKEVIEEKLSNEGKKQLILLERILNFIHKSEKEKENDRIKTYTECVYCLIFLVFMMFIIVGLLNTLSEWIMG